MSFEAVQQVADAVLYEGYLLYPYHAASDKNRVRFQFGVVAPRDFSESDGSESWAMQTECLLVAGTGSRVDVRARFLQLQARAIEAIDPAAASGFARVGSLEVDGEPLIPWEEAVERDVDVTGLLDDLATEERTIPFAIDGGEEAELVRDRGGDVVGRIVRTRWPIEGRLLLHARSTDGFIRLRVRVENLTISPDGPTDRADALRRSLLGCHTLLAVSPGSFVSLMDPPPDAAAAAAGCENIGTWPVLAGDGGHDDLVLSSPIILYDHPAIAPESRGDLFDATEIDEILTLRIMTLGDDEKRLARATDPRARAIIDATADLPPEMLDRLHGAIRSLRAPADDGFVTPASSWAPAARVAPDRAAIEIGGVVISKGASVRLRPNRRADSMDMFLAGRAATVEAVYESVDDATHVAVTIDDDPATDLHRAYGRFYYFSPDELEPLAPAPSGDGPAPVALTPSGRSVASR